MNLRDALINQSPSLALLRAAANEIARQDAQLAAWRARHCATEALNAHEETADLFDPLGWQAKREALQAECERTWAKVQQLCL